MYYLDYFFRRLNNLMYEVTIYDTCYWGTMCMRVLFNFCALCCVAYPDPGSGLFDPLIRDPGWVKISVADPGCLSWIPDPDFYPSRISDPVSRIQKQQQKREVKKIRCQTFLCSHKI